MAMIKTCSTPPIAFPEVSGPVCSFKALQALPLKKCEVAINAWQEGSGDPSPENNRPIHGWDEVNVFQRGTNQWDEEWEVGSISNTTGKNTEATKSYRTKNYIPLVSSVDYYFYIGGTYTLGLRFYDINKNFISSRPLTVSGILRWNYEIPSKARFVRFVNTSTNTYNNDISINYPSTDTDYHAYTGNTYTIQLGQAVYGAEVDAVNGVANVTHIKKVIDENSGVTRASNGILYLDDFFDIPEDTTSVMCNCYTRGANRSTVAEVMTNNLNYSFCCKMGGTTQIRVMIKDTRFGTIEEFNEWVTLNPISMLIKLATPITVQLTPVQIDTILNTNNIFADTGDTTVQYIKIGG